MDVINGKKTTIFIDITEGDDYASLDDSDVVTYSLYDSNGGIVDDIEDVEVQIDDENRNTLKIEVPASANFIPEGNNFSTRILIVDYTINGSLKTVRKSYRVIPFVGYTCTNSDVRTTLGVADNTIEDDMIDIYAAYLKCKSLFDDETLLDSKLINGDLDFNKANRAIVLCSALSFRNSLPLLTPKIESDSVVSQTRFTMSYDDFMKMFDDLQNELNDLIDDLSGVDEENRYTVNMFVIGELTDTFTGR